MTLAAPPEALSHRRAAAGSEWPQVGADMLDDDGLSAMFVREVLSASQLNRTVCRQVTLATAPRPSQWKINSQE